MENKELINTIKNSYNVREKKNEFYHFLLWSRRFYSRAIILNAIMFLVVLSMFAYNLYNFIVGAPGYTKLMWFFLMVVWFLVDVMWIVLLSSSVRKFNYTDRTLHKVKKSLNLDSEIINNGLELLERREDTPKKRPGRPSKK